jgi:hypothetical protein
LSAALSANAGPVFSKLLDTELSMRHLLCCGI